MLTELSEMVTDSKLVLAIFLAWIQWKSLVTAFEKLLALNYNSFILTVGIIGVDSHARDMYGNSHSQGTCVLLEIPSM